PLAQLTLRFGPAEYCWVGVFGITIISSLSSGAFLKGITGAAFGVLISTIGIAPVGGDVRFTFGFPAMQAGVDLIVVLNGMLSMRELLNPLFNSSGGKEGIDYKPAPGVLVRTVRQVLAMPRDVLRSSIIGTMLGILPGPGGHIANLVSYNEAK